MQHFTDAPTGYRQIDVSVMQYERTEASLRSFTESVSNVITPLHQIAANKGFPTWTPSVEYAVVGL